MHKLQMHEFDWTEDRCAELRERWAAGESCSMIGAGFGVSRNAVIGKIKRLGLPAPAFKLHVQFPQRAPGISSSAIYRRRAKERWCTWMPKREPPPKQVENTEFQVSFMGLKEHHCRWIAGEVEGLDTIYCGDVKADGGSYCSFHNRKAIGRSMRSDEHIDAAVMFRRMARMRTAKKKAAA